MLGYIDGAQVGSGYTPGALATADSNEMDIGVWSAYFVGTVDEVSLYPTCLTPTKLAAHYAAGTTASGGATVAVINMASPAAPLATVAAASQAPAALVRRLHPSAP